MKRLLILLCLLIGLAAPAQGEYWQNDQPILCQEDRPGCRILQLTMKGAFDRMDLADTLNARTLAAALPWLRGVTQEDVAHFMAYFPETNEETLWLNYHIALGNCLLSDIRTSQAPFSENQQQARQVLRVFLDPQGVADGQQIRASIRSRMTDEAARTLADAAQVPLSFVEFLAYTNNYELHRKSP